MVLASCAGLMLMDGRVAKGLVLVRYVRIVLIVWPSTLPRLRAMCVWQWDSASRRLCLSRISAGGGALEWFKEYVLKVREGLCFLRA